MAVSIATAQRSFLNSGGLNNLGSNNDFTTEGSLSALEQLAGILIKETQQNLDQSGQVSSGALSDSFTIADPQEAGKVIKLDISALDYFDFQNKGVRGVGGGSSGANYSFKNANPSTGMVTAIEEWMSRGGMSTANVQKTVSNNELKNKTISQYDSAYAVARGIKIRGIKGTGYFDKAIKTAQQYAQEVLGKGLAVDVTLSLPRTLNTNNSSNGNSN